MSFFRWAILGALLCTPSFSKADLAIRSNLSQSDFTVGQSGYLELWVSSTTDNQYLDGFLFGLQVTGGNGIRFTDPLTNGFVNNPGYVLYGRSDNQATGTTGLTVTNGGQSAGYSDFSSDGNIPPGANPVIVAGADSPMLLGRFGFTATEVGGFEFEFTGDQFAFSDDNFSEIAYSVAAIPSVNVTAVPEPSSMALLAISGAGAAWYKRRRKLAAEVAPAA